MVEQKRLYRIKQDRMIGGVCAGLGRYTGLDPVIFRALFVLFTVFGGFGIIAYLALWLITPEEEGREMAGEDTVRRNINDMALRFRELTGSFGGGSGRALAGLMLIVFGGVFLLREFLPIDIGGFIWPLLLIGVGIYVLTRNR